MFWTFPGKNAEVFSIADECDQEIFLWVADFDRNEKLPIGLYSRDEVDSVANAILSAF